MLYMIEYDLRKPFRNYQPLYEELAKFNAKRVLKSLWTFGRINTNAEHLRDHFRQYIDADDGLIVMQVGDWATFNTENTPKAVVA